MQVSNTAVGPSKSQRSRARRKPYGITPHGDEGWWRMPPRWQLVSPHPRRNLCVDLLDAMLHMGWNQRAVCKHCVVHYQNCGVLGQLQRHWLSRAEECKTGAKQVVHVENIFVWQSHNHSRLEESSLGHIPARIVICKCVLCAGMLCATRSAVNCTVAQDSRQLDVTAHLKSPHTFRLS